MTLPKSTPPEHIVSNFFGERILVDLKTVYSKGYIVVAIDHFTSYTWTKFVLKKDAGPIAEFVGSVFADVDRIRKERPQAETFEGDASAQLYATNSEVIFDFSYAQELCS